ncbi:lipid A 1-phosphatase LpxE [Rhizobium sp. XQZ8]|uniref:lipid A 1-phosphatase LpxE n=1 Tax=Rhizobium populisoli TaxID=2859785 RepID=UPI001C66D850|nr:lipid A 1-phosphatase LpxE [Rhizobium populisoli]MBW6424486.1 lipid A 1-phosphatase LpxE [Rhizobium populisoli]
MKRTIDKLKLRRERYRLSPPLPRLWAFAFVTVNLILIALVLLDAPVGSYGVHTPNALRPLGRLMTDFGSSGWILFASVILFFEALAVVRLAPGLKSRFQAMLVSHVAAFMFISVAGSGLLANLLKRAIGRARPGLYEEWGMFSLHPFAGSSRFESFPSGHATTVGAIFMVIALLFPRYRLHMLIGALWLGFSRVIVEAHYPSDVIAGLAFGAWFTILAAIVFARYGLLFRQELDGWPVLRRPVPLVGRPDWSLLPFPPRGVPAKRGD